ncbi:MAG TPA: GGDEF domain-containing protein, partial [Pseudoneobacillus sp.]|nr:GGDEF domain-containing protein [Pseudoneobacillus sp.]
TEVENSSVKVEFNSNEISVSYTASFGLYYFKINEPITIEKGYIYADHLLLQSKEQGRNRVTVKKIS